MARTVDEIKAEMTAAFIAESAVVSSYGLDSNKTFDQQFSKASIESILFYVFAAALWTLEKLFDLHVGEVEEQIEELEPHTLRWYVSKAKAFMQGMSLVTDCDYYDTSNMSDDDIEEAQIIKYAVATESNTVVYLKVARDVDGSPAQLTDAQLTAFTSYINTVKDAGVSVVVRNESADLMAVSMVVYYDATLLASDGTSLSDGSTPVVDAVKEAIASLPFNGVFRKTDLLTAVQGVSGVEVVDITEMKVKTANADDWTELVGFNRPYSGYYALDEDSSSITYVQYEEVE